MIAGRSLKLFTLFGIRIGVSTSWFVILFVLLYLFTEDFQQDLGLQSTAAFGLALAAAVGFFGSILLHELGHALAARREGIEVAGIDLFIFGGVMKMNSEGPSAGALFRIAAAGPLVTLLIVLALGALGAVGLGWEATSNAARLDAGAQTSAAQQLVGLLVAVNFVLLIFNLIPAIPLDGGQILRSAVWAVTGDRSKATRVAARLGQAFSFLLIAFGTYQLLRGDAFGGIWSIGLGFLIGQGARAAGAHNAFTERLQGVTVADIMDSQPLAIPAGLDAAQAYEEFFERYRDEERIAVVADDGRLVGVADRAVMRRAVEPGASGGSLAGQVAGGRSADDHVRDDAPLEVLLGSEPLRRLGALMVLDGEDRLRGVVTVDQVSRALRSRLTAA